MRETHVKYGGDGGGGDGSRSHPYSKKAALHISRPTAYRIPESSEKENILKQHEMIAESRYQVSDMFCNP